MIKKTRVNLSKINLQIAESFDYTFTGEICTEIKDYKALSNALNDDYGIGLIVGASGSGKSSIARELGLIESNYDWTENESICSHFKSADDARDKLGAVGLNSVPSWLKPYNILSTGEKFRADMAISLKDNAFIDEFTSVVDRNVAKSCSKSLRKYVDKSGLSNLVLASCHYDIIEWLQPDWVFDCSSGQFQNRGSCRQFPKIEIKIEPCGWEVWSAFKNHHYLDGNINKSATFWLATWEGVEVGFASTIAFPSGSVKNARRGHRTVVLPDYQGLGIGTALSDAVAQMTIDEGYRYFSKTSHDRMGKHREDSPQWKATSKNRKSRPDYSSKRKTKEDNHKMKHVGRVCYSHEFLG